MHRPLYGSMVSGETTGSGVRLQTEGIHGGVGEGPIVPFYNSLGRAKMYEVPQMRWDQAVNLRSYNGLVPFGKPKIIHREHEVE